MPWSEVHFQTKHIFSNSTVNENNPIVSIKYDDKFPAEKSFTMEVIMFDTKSKSNLIKNLNALHINISNEQENSFEFTLEFSSDVCQKVYDKLIETQPDLYHISKKLPLLSTRNVCYIDSSVKPGDTDFLRQQQAKNTLHNYGYINSEMEKIKQLMSQLEAQQFPQTQSTQAPPMNRYYGTVFSNAPNTVAFKNVASSSMSINDIIKLNNTLKPGESVYVDCTVAKHPGSHAIVGHVPEQLKHLFPQSSGINNPNNSSSATEKSEVNNIGGRPLQSASQYTSNSATFFPTDHNPTHSRTLQNNYRVDLLPVYHKLGVQNGQLLQPILKGITGEKSDHYVQNSSKVKKDLICEIDFVSEDGALKLIKEIKSQVNNILNGLPVESNSSVATPK